MKPSISFGIKTALIVGASVWLAMTFNSARTDRLPLVRDPQVAAQVAAERGEISLADATLLFRSGQAVFVDAREAEEFALGHIEGALSLDPLSFGQEFPALRERMEGKTVVTYCDGEQCQLSHELAEQLKGMGLLDVRVLRNGWSLWTAQGLPTATGGQTAPQDPALDEGLEEQEPDDAVANASVPAAPEAMEPAPASEPVLPELPENATEDRESSALPVAPETIDPAPMNLPVEDPALNATPTAPVNEAPTDLAPSAPQQTPSVQPPLQDENKPISETQGEHS